MATSHWLGWLPLALASKFELDLGGSDWWLRGVSWASTESSVRVTVPGDINDALHQAGRFGLEGDLYYGLNLESRAVHNAAYESWWLNKTVQVPSEWLEMAVCRIIFQGVDYNATFYFNGEQLGSSVGMYREAAFDVTSFRPDGGNEVAVLFEPPPRDLLDQWLAPGNAAQSVMYDYLTWWKSMVGLGYDFGQPIWTQGLWDTVRFVAADRHACLLSDLTVLPEVAAPYDFATLHLAVAIENVENPTWHLKLTWTVASISELDKVVAVASAIQPVFAGVNKALLNLELREPQLWWPRGLGPQHLYKVIASLHDPKSGTLVHEVSQIFGVRHLEERENPGPDSWRYIEEFACGPPGDQFNCTFPSAGSTAEQVRANRSWTFEINGRRMFAKGANWVPCDMMLGKCGTEDYAYLLRLVVESNHNYLRVWGGGGIEKQAFYELADSLGILVYQEMVHSQAMPSRADNLVAEQQEIEAAIKRVMSHPSVVRYGWGNEFYGVNYTSNVFERQFEDIARAVDGTRKAIHGSPVTWAQRHGPYCFYFSNVGGGGSFPCLGSPGYAAYNAGTMNQEGPNDPFEWDEYGASGIASEYSLRKMIPEQHIFPVNVSQEDWVFHRASGVYGTIWLSRDSYVPMFGEPLDLKHEIYASQFAQSEGLRYANQAHRRAMPHRSLSAYWTFNEVWPDAAYGSVVEFYGPPKMAYYVAAKRPYAATDVSLRYEQIAYAAGAQLTASVWCVSEAAQLLDLELSATMLTLESETISHQAWRVKVGGVERGPGTSTRVGDLDMTMPESVPHDAVLLRVKAVSASKGCVVTEEVYVFGLLPRGTQPADWDGIKPPLRGLWEAADVALDVSVRKGAGEHAYELTLSNPTSAPALYVELKPQSLDVPEHEQFHPAVLSDNFFILFTGEHRTIAVELLNWPHEDKQLPDNFCVSGWNVPRLCVPLGQADTVTRFI